jgi:hypothetical protein
MSETKRALKKRKLDNKPKLQKGQVYFPAEGVWENIIEYVGNSCDQLIDENICSRTFTFVVADEKEKAELKAKNLPIRLNCARQCIDLNSSLWFWSLLTNLPDHVNLECNLRTKSGDIQRISIKEKINSIRSPAFSLDFATDSSPKFIRITKIHPEIAFDGDNLETPTEDIADQPVKFATRLRFGKTDKMADYVTPSVVYNLIQPFMLHNAFRMKIVLTLTTIATFDAISESKNAVKIGLNAIDNISVVSFESNGEKVSYFGRPSNWQVRSNGRNELTLVLLIDVAPPKKKQDEKVLIDDLKAFDNTSREMNEMDQNYRYWSIDQGGDLEDWYISSEIHEAQAKASVDLKPTEITPSP